MITEVHQEGRFYRMSTGRAAHYENIKPQNPSTEDWCIPADMEEGDYLMMDPACEVIEKGTREKNDGNEVIEEGTSTPLDLDPNEVIEADDETLPYAEEDWHLLVWTPPRGASGDARFILCGKDSHRGTGKRNLWKLETESEATSRMPTEWKRLWPPQTREGADQRRRRKTGFFSAGPGKPAYLARLLVMAGNVEENPGPYECGMCQKRVSGCSIKCK